MTYPFFMPINTNKGLKMSYFKGLISESARENQELILDFVVFSLNTVSQFHIFHLLTTDAQQHDALGAFYDGLNDSIDGFAEYFLGENTISGSIPTTPYAFDTNVSLATILQKLDEYDNFMLKVRDVIDEKNEGSLIDSINDIKELISKLKYKLKMN